MWSKIRPQFTSRASPYPHHILAVSTPDVQLRKLLVPQNLGPNSPFKRSKNDISFLGTASYVNGSVARAAVFPADCGVVPAAAQRAGEVTETKRDSEAI